MHGHEVMSRRRWRARGLRHVRACVAAAGLLAATTAAAASDTAYLQVPGLIGPSTSTRHPGWFDVTQDTIVLVPGAFSAERNAVVSRCTATLRTRVGVAGAVLTKLVGSALGTLTLDRISPTDTLPLHHATLRNAVLASHTMVFEGGGAYDVLSLTFDAIEVTTYQRNADGTLGPGAQGTFDCLVVR